MTAKVSQMIKSLFLSLVVFLGYQVIASGQLRPSGEINISSLYNKVTLPVNQTARHSNQAGQHRTQGICDTIILNRQSAIDSFPVLYAGCSTVGILMIDGQNASPAITNLDSLQTITGVTGNLVIRNTSITNLSALSSLVQIGDTLQLEHNSLLTSIGLNNLTELGGIILLDLPVLTSIDGLSNNLSTTGTINIDSTALTNLNGLSGITSITNGIFYGLRVAHTPIVNLNSLANLTIIQGYLILDNNPDMTSIGLTNLTQCSGFLFGSLPNLTSIANLTTNLSTTSIGTFWMIQTGLSDLSGLSGLTSASNFYIWLNPNLTSLQGLENLSGNIDGGISFWANDQLTDITALSNITSLNNGTLEIHGNNLLSDLTGLGNITVVGQRLRVFENPVITSLDFLHPNLDIQDNNNEGVEIRDNSQLALCSFAPLCTYLNNGGFGDIQNNAAGCSSAAEILASCNTCTVSVLKTWTGSINTDWNEAGNWAPAGVPAICDTVYIPTGLPDYPVANYNITIHGLIMEYGTTLDLGNYSLINNGEIEIFDAAINSNNNSNAIIFRNAINISVENATLSANNIRIEGYKGELYFIENVCYGNITISDSASRTGQNIIYGNTFNGNFSITTNSTDANAETFLSAGGEDEVLGNVTLTINEPVTIHVGSGNALKIEGDLTVNTDMDPQYIGLNEIKFIGGGSSHIRQGGSTPITIQNLYPEKSSRFSYIIPEQDIYIGFRTQFLGGLIKTTPSKLLIFKDDAHINQTSSESWVWGPLRKIGNDQFQFPVGDSLKQAVMSMTAPSSVTDVFTAQYYRTNPTAAGYDTAQHALSLSYISGKEYWMLNRDNGTSTVRVTLNYDSTRSNTTASLYSLRIAQWNGSQWLNRGVSSLTGNLGEAFITSIDTLSSFEPLTLGYIEPPVIPVITLGNTDSVACRNGTIKVRFTVDTLMYSNNNFIAQLSDSTGSFSNPTNIGTRFNSNRSDSITAFIPFNTPLSDLYKIRVIGTSPPDTSINFKPLIVRAIPSLPFTVEGTSPACIGGGVYKYYPSQKEAGVNFNWTLGSGGTFTTNQDTIYVTWTTAGNHLITLQTSNQCGNGPSANKLVSVAHPAPTQVPVLTKTGRWLYSSAPAPAQNAAGYHWYRNDTLISSSANSSYYASQGGTYTVRYYNTCGDGPASNLFSFAENSIPQTISFPSIPAKTYGDSAFVVNVSASSGLPVSLQLISGPGSLSGNTYTITTTGSAALIATQQGDDVYDTAAPVTQHIVVNKASQTIDFPAIADQLPGAGPLMLNATASSGLQASYTLISGPATLAGNQLTITGLGTVSVTAQQNGDTNYLAATAINRTFCIRVTELTTITGTQFVCPGEVVTYKINNVPGLIYNWRLSDGTTYPSTVDSVMINWNTPGTYTLIVSATGPCGSATANDSLTVNVITAVTPGAVSNMLPVNGAIDQQLPLSLSWLPGSNAVNYDLYVWDSAAAAATTPYATNIPTVQYIIPGGSLLYNKAYKWKVISKNACLQTEGPVQQFRLKKLPDLAVSDVQAPATAFSGQTISFSWKVTNNGPGTTTTNQSWNDAVFLSFDTVPNFTISPNTSPAAWSQLEFPVRPLLVGTRSNVTALDSGQHYTNSLNFTLPVNYSQPLYAYVITNYPNGINAPLQTIYINDTARAPQAVTVTLSPTPDLRIDTVFTPASTFSGSTISVTYKVKNYGVLTPAGSSWTDKLYISQSPTFNLNTATALTLVKPNGTYYPNTIDAAVNNNTQLLADSAYTKTLQVVIPNFISGPYFIYVVCNANNSVYEGALANNNTGNNQLQVFLTPTPVLIVSSLTVPVSLASTTQPIGINWNIQNTGFNDNIEKNKGHYYLPAGTCNNIANGINLIDSVGFGSSYWVDRIYLSTDSTGINGAAVEIASYPQGILGSGISADFSPATKCVTAGTNPSSENINTTNVIRQGSNHPASFNFTIPSDLPAGNYYVYVKANAGQHVYEYPGTPQIKRSSLPINIQRPDVVVSNVTAPANTISGQPVTVNYSILNNGPGSVFNHVRKDKIYVSSSAIFDGSAVLISTQTYTESLPVGTPVVHSFNYSFPAGLTGSRYFYVHTNTDSSFRETNNNNNSNSAVTLVGNATPVDLVVSSVPLADSIYTIYASQIKYTVTNNGPGNTYGSWTDSIYISCSPTFSSSSSFYIGKRTHSEVLTTGNSYTDSFTVNIPYSFAIHPCFPELAYSTAYFFVKTNTSNQLYEGTNASNNVTGSGARVLVNPLVDHIVTSVSGADTTTAGRPYTTTWTVKNIGYNPGNIFYYYFWYDAVYFSTDSVFNNNAIPASNFVNTTRLERNQTYSETKTATVPNIPTGDYYVFVKTNYNSAIFAEKVVNNNANLIRNESGAAKKIHVIQPPLPDLVDTILSIPVSAAIGQPLTIVHKVTNSGVGVTYPSGWSNSAWLSTDFIPGNAGDLLLTTVNRSGNLLPGQSYTDTVTTTLNILTPPGNYILLLKADVNNAVFESNDTNNVAYGYITVYSPAPSDLVVHNIMKPDTAWLGYTIDTAKWVVGNISVNNAAGISSDGIYLSKNMVLDSTAVLLGIKNKTINLPPLGKDTISLQPLITGVTEGNYNVLVKTDLLNNITESDKTNNTGVSVSSIYVKAKELLLNTPENNSLHTITRYYKLQVPDSLRGSTILVTLKTNDSLTMRNEMYIGLGYVPSASAFDYRFETANYGNQQIVMTSVVDSVYYIAYRCVSPNPLVQNITLKAVKLPFAILTVQSNSGGNIGNVTVKISGSLFTSSMTATLEKPGTTIYSSSVFFVNSTTVFATFNLQGRSLGLYSVSLQKADSAIATLANSFTIANANNGGILTGGGPNTGQSGTGTEPGCDPGTPSGLNSQLVTEIVVPEKVFVGWPFVIQINYTNPSNNDIPAQVRILYNDKEVMLAKTTAELAAGNTSLHLELAEPGGPPGIIRAGASGTITVYGKTPLNMPGHTMINFTLR